MNDVRLPDNESHNLTGPALRYAESRCGGVRCVVCDRFIPPRNAVYVVPTTHGDPAYAVTLTFSCPKHKAGVGQEFCKRIVQEDGAGLIVCVDHDLPTEVS